VFLDVELKTSQLATGVGAVFSVARPYRFSKNAWAIIESHFKRLKLIERYTDFAQRRNSGDSGRLQDLHNNWQSQRSTLLETKGTGKGGRPWRKPLEIRLDERIS
jgi:hypothetical protein